MFYTDNRRAKLEERDRRKTLTSFPLATFCFTSENPFASTWAIFSASVLSAFDGVVPSLFGFDGTGLESFSSSDEPSTWRDVKSKLSKNRPISFCVLL